MTQPTARTTLPLPAPPLVTMADIMAAKRPATETVPICVDPALTRARDTAAEALERAQGAADLSPEREDLQAALKTARVAHGEAVAACQAATVTFTFRALARPALAKMLRDHPPTAPQVDDFQAELRALGLPSSRRPQFNPDTFPPALIAAAAIEPAITLEQAMVIWGDDDEAWSDAETEAMFTAAWTVNKIIAS